MLLWSILLLNLLQTSGSSRHKLRGHRDSISSPQGRCNGRGERGPELVPAPAELSNHCTGVTGTHDNAAVLDLV